MREEREKAHNFIADWSTLMAEITLDEPETGVKKINLIKSQECFNFWVTNMAVLATQVHWLQCRSGFTVWEAVLSVSSGSGCSY